jgi:hypothetical protein
VPLTLAAALGALAFNHVEFTVTTSIILGSVPAVLIGSFLSSRAPDKYIRPAITFVIFASGLKYAGVGTTALGWILCAVLLTAGATWLALARPWQPGPARAEASGPGAGTALASANGQAANGRAANGRAAPRSAGAAEAEEEPAADDPAG